ncbi:MULTISPECIES: hypothetical protein [unclassified Streptomyces]|uniref:hypothetical protein n=1 Tax=unclassified Streptomyces TaxID=2593676 RepID=UPI000BF5441C|nr:hypothetical protein [Streptomyces sp. Ru87]PGH47938.1 hypothetical protein CRI70_25765 [Streptomyces sp. Ru87]
MGWIDNDTVPRDAENTFEGRFGALGISSAEKPEPVAPGNDRDNNDPGALARRAAVRLPLRPGDGEEAPPLRHEARFHTPENRLAGDFAALGDTAVPIDRR